MPIIFDDQYLGLAGGPWRHWKVGVLWLVGAIVFRLLRFFAACARLTAVAERLHGSGGAAFRGGDADVGARSRSCSARSSSSRSQHGWIAPRAPGPRSAGGAVDPAPPPLRRRPGGRGRVHRRDGRHDDRAQRDVPGGPGAFRRWPAAWRRLAIPVAAIGGSITSSGLLARIGRGTMQIGIVTMAVGLLVVDLVMRSANGGLTAWELAGPLAITGFGMGMVFVPMFDVILAGVAPHQLGSASGLLESVQQLAMSLGIAVVGRRPVRRPGQRPRAGRVRRRRRPRVAGRGRLPDRGVRGGAVAAQARAAGSLEPSV